MNRPRSGHRELRDSGKRALAEPCAQLPVGDAHNMTVSWQWRTASISGAAAGVGSMAIGVLVAGIGLVLAGLLAIGFGVPVKEFSFGNTLILIGAIGVCSGAIMIALWMAIRELKNIARRLGAGMPEPRGEISVRPVLPPGAVREPPADSGALFAPAGASSARAAAAPPPWQDEAARAITRRRLARGRPAEVPRRSSQAEAQSDVFLDLAQRTRARAGAHQRAVAAGHAVGGYSPEPGRRRRRRPNRPSRRRRRSTMPGRSRIAGGLATFRRSARSGGRLLRRRANGAPARDWRSAGGDGAEIRRRRRHGLFALFGRFDRGPDAGGHDALRLDRRIARASRPSAVAVNRRQYLGAGRYRK